jgi:hypothetical protein
MRVKRIVFLIGKQTVKSLLVNRQQNSYQTQTMHTSVERFEHIVVPIRCEDCSHTHILRQNIEKIELETKADEEKQFFLSSKVHCKGCGANIRVCTRITLYAKGWICNVETENCHIVRVFGLSEILHELARLGARH